MEATEATASTESTAAASGEVAPAATPAATASGEGAGTQASADSFAEERARLEAQARSHQGRADRLAQEKADLELRLAAAPAAASSATPEPAAAGLTLEQVRAENVRMVTLMQAASALRGDKAFAAADPSIFDRAMEYNSPESLRVAAEQSHRDRLALQQQGRDALIEEIKAAGGQVPSATTPTTSGSTAPATGLPTKEDLAAMPQAEYEAFVEKNGDAVVKSILRSDT